MLRKNKFLAWVIDTIVFFIVIGICMCTGSVLVAVFHELLKAGQ